MEPLSQDHHAFVREAIRLAEQAEQRGNLPVGAVIALDGQTIARGANAIWSPALDLTRHAEMEALRSVPRDLWPRSREMTLYTSLEPCLMCAGAILLHQLGSVVYGAADPDGGATAGTDSLPPYFRREFALLRWVGPALPSECDPLYARMIELERRRALESPTPPAES